MYQHSAANVLVHYNSEPIDAGTWHYTIDVNVRHQDSSIPNIHGACFQQASDIHKYIHDVQPYFHEKQIMPSK